ncbi:MAG: right-handed parallel beta-helix repeat-containing protein [Syntrophobacteraceae bacterium]
MSKKTYGEGGPLISKRRIGTFLSALVLLAVMSMTMPGGAAARIDSPADSHAAAAPTSAPPAQVAGVTVLCVATTGNDADPGTLARPWRTIQKAADAAVPGNRIYVRGGLYNERVTINVSGTAEEGYITFQNYPNETPIVDGAGLIVPADDNGLFLIADRGYVTIKGFELRNYKTSARDRVPVGIHIRGASHHIQVRNNRVHNIEHNGAWATGTDAHGIAAYGTSATEPIQGLVIDGNELYALKLGSSESLVVNGNVSGFRITNNKVHNNNNIGIDAIGFEGVSPDPATDQARNGRIASNLVYNINSYGNPAYGTDRSAGGIYVDGGRDIVVERNVVHHCNIGVELASEHHGRATSHITVRGNFIYLNDVVGISMGGYDTLRGSTQNCVVVNNTLFRNDRLRWGNGELALQYDTRNNTVKNNIFYANSQNYLITNPFTLNTGNIFDYNLYYAPGGAAGAIWQWKKKLYTGFGAYRSATGKEGRSTFANPRVVGTTLPDLHLQATSPAIDAGQDLAVAGTLDIDGQKRTQNVIDIGADEVR